VIRMRLPAIMAGARLSKYGSGFLWTLERAPLVLEGRGGRSPELVIRSGRRTLTRITNPRIRGLKVSNAAPDWFTVYGITPYSFMLPMRTVAFCLKTLGFSPKHTQWFLRQRRPDRVRLQSVVLHLGISFRSRLPWLSLFVIRGGRGLEMSRVKCWGSHRERHLRRNDVTAVDHFHWLQLGRRARVTELIEDMKSAYGMKRSRNYKQIRGSIESSMGKDLKALGFNPSRSKLLSAFLSNPA